MVNVVIGTGSKTAGSAANFNALIWSASAKTLVVGLSTSGSCSSFIEISNQNFTGVPYAFATKTAENVTGVVAITNGGTGAATAAGAKRQHWRGTRRVFSAHQPDRLHRPRQYPTDRPVQRW